MHLTSRYFLKFTALVLLVPTIGRALPADNLHLQSLNTNSAPWSTGVFYHLAPVQGGVGVRADLGFQLVRTLGEDKLASVMAHVQADSLLLAFSHMTKPVFSAPARWTVGIDLSSPFSYLGEGQLFFPMGKFEPYLALRMQSTGFSVVGGDGNLYKTGASARFWLASAALGAGYHLQSDLRIAASYTYRTALGQTSFREPGVFHLSMQWLWGDRTSQ